MSGIWKLSLLKKSSQSKSNLQKQGAVVPQHGHTVKEGLHSTDHITNCRLNKDVGID